MLYPCLLIRSRAALSALIAVALSGIGAIPVRAQVTLPLEVMGTSSATVTVSVNVSQSASPVTALKIQVSGIEYPTQASIQVNNQPWLALNNANFQIDAVAASWGGIGGPVANMGLTLPLPPGWVGSGATTLSFRFNQSDGVSSGYRVRAFNFQRADGSIVLPASAFVFDNPGHWTPPLNDPADIAAGKSLWQSYNLQISPGGSMIQAHCGDCHAEDGRDLKYFNYSNYSIEIRSQFHGMNSTQGQQVASYIRSLRIPSPGLPWNPPYQPGPGLDNLPVSSWAAGAGSSAILSDDSLAVTYLFPNGINKSAIATTSYLNVRETPLAMPLPTWNQWLPTTHPMDFWGSAFTSSKFATDYEQIAQALATNQANGTLDTYLSSNTGFSHDLYLWTAVDLRSFNLGYVKKKIKQWTPPVSEGVYSDGKWHMVKVWEMMQQYQLEDKGDLFFGSTNLTEPRTWNSAAAFITSPKAQSIPEKDGESVGGKALTQHYFADAWYQLQLVLNPGNGQQDSTTPIDWSYNYGVIDHSAIMNGKATAIRLLEYFVKGMQESDNGLPPSKTETGWSPAGIDAIYLIEHDQKMWQGIPKTTQAQILTAMLGTWLDKTSSIPPSEYYGVVTDAQQTPYLKNPVFGILARWVDEVAWMIIHFRAAGADNTLCNSVCDWAQTVWPNWDWSQLKK